MLITYTPDEQGDAVEILYRHALGCCSCRNDAPPIVCRTDTGFAVKTSWCREIVTDNLRDMLTDTPPGIVNIYGIRKHGTSLSYQPSGCPGKLSQRTAYVDNLLSEFFQLMVECISCILDDGVMKPERLSNWIYRWRSVSFSRKFAMNHSFTGPDIKCILNADENDVPRLATDSFWNKSRMFGSIINIPSNWVSCVPVMSYLMYIPRLWGAFYSTPRILPKLSQISKRRLTYQTGLSDIIGSPLGHSPSSYNSQLWLALAHRLMLPSWFTPCGKEYFWTFTYLLVKHAVHKIYYKESPSEDIKEALYSLNTRGGLKSWCSWYRSSSGSPAWFKDMLTNLGGYGVSSVLKFDSIVNYI